MILPVDLYVCETRSLTLWEECRLRVFENRVLRRIFGPKWDEVTWEWRRLHNKELYALYCSLTIIGVIKSIRMRWTGRLHSFLNSTPDALGRNCQALSFPFPSSVPREKIPPDVLNRWLFGPQSRYELKRTYCRCRESKESSSVLGPVIWLPYRPSSPGPLTSSVSTAGLLLFLTLYVYLLLVVLFKVRAATTVGVTVSSLHAGICKETPMVCRRQVFGIGG